MFQFLLLFFVAWFGCCHLPLCLDILCVFSSATRLPPLSPSARAFSWNEFKSLWGSDKMIVCEEFVNRGLPLVHIDEKFLFYTNIVERMNSNRYYHDFGPIRINLHALMRSSCAHVVEWKNTLGNILTEKTLTNLHRTQKYVTVKSK